ncbi:MAG: biotin--[acetyl-CoA-carboxylase] ligase [Elusimicrobiales bacterium]|nr:biotin--[acetyl-CoA-carboxylase] ligase [Elusimicrobiales bacterium]
MPDSKILRFDTLPSTQDYAVELARKAEGREWTAVVADAQTKGRGTGGNDWYSPAGQNLYFSLIAWPAGTMADPAVINHSAALAAAEVLSGYGINCRIKWPNDLLAGGKKISGILSTSGKNRAGDDFIVCGIGLNVDTREFPPGLSGSATSMELAAGQSPDKEELLRKLLESLKRRFLLLFKSGFAGEVAEYVSLMAQIGDAYTPGKGGPAGTIAGISEKGWLLVKYSGGIEAVRPYG